MLDLGAELLEGLHLIDGPVPYTMRRPLAQLLLALVIVNDTGWARTKTW